MITLALFDLTRDWLGLISGAFYLPINLPKNKESKFFLSLISNRNIHIWSLTIWMSLSFALILYQKCFSFWKANVTLPATLACHIHGNHPLEIRRLFSLCVYLYMTVPNWSIWVSNESTKSFYSGVRVYNFIDLFHWNNNQKLIKLIRVYSTKAPLMWLFEQIF